MRQVRFALSTVKWLAWLALLILTAREVSGAPQAPRPPQGPSCPCGDACPSGCGQGPNCTCASHSQPDCTPEQRRQWEDEGWQFSVPPTGGKKRWWRYKPAES